MFRVRGHTLLCLQGFRGKGYSDAFVANMERIHKTLFDNPQMEVEVVISPDDICSACPHLKDNQCTLNGTGTERDMADKDNNVIKILDLYPGGKYRWDDILFRIPLRLTPEMLKELCSKCQWLPFGYCTEGIKLLNQKSKVNPESSSGQNVI